MQIELRRPQANLSAIWNPPDLGIQLPSLELASFVSSSNAVGEGHEASERAELAGPVPERLAPCNGLPVGVSEHPNLPEEAIFVGECGDQLLSGSLLVAIVPQLVLPKPRRSGSGVDAESQPSELLRKTPI